MDFNQIYNYIEIGLWTVIGLAFAVRALRPAFRNLKITAAVTFGLFAVSEVIEIHTGAWWKPWWLFGLKAVCVVNMCVLMMIYINKTKEPEPQNGKDGQ